MTHFSTFILIATLAFAGYSHGETVQMPAECRGKKYCTKKPSNYQNYEEDFDRYIKTSKYWLGIGAKSSDLEDIESFNPDPVNCGHITKVEKPFIISVNTTDSTNDSGQIVVQSEFFEQKIRTTTCLEKTSCFEDLKMEIDNLKTGCDERYSTITLYVYENGKIRPQPFPIPVSCACKVQFGTD